MKILITDKEFKEHTENHIKNVSKIASEMVDYILSDKDYMQHFNIPLNINKTKLKEKILSVIEKHDKAKITSENYFLEKYDLEEPLYKTFFNYVGKNPKEHPELGVLIKKLNSIDEEIISNELINKPQWFKDLTMKIEKFSDSVERGCNYVTKEELGREPLKASQFLKDFLHEKELKMVISAENNYPRTTNKYIPEHIQESNISYSHIDLSNKITYNNTVNNLSKKIKLI